jgi:hypothetical protein
MRCVFWYARYVRTIYTRRGTRRGIRRDTRRGSRRGTRLLVGSGIVHGGVGIDDALAEIGIPNAKRRLKYYE